MPDRTWPTAAQIQHARDVLDMIDESYAPRTTSLIKASATLHAGLDAISAALVGKTVYQGRLMVPLSRATLRLLALALIDPSKETAVVRALGRDLNAMERIEGHSFGSNWSLRRKLKRLGVEID